MKKGGVCSHSQSSAFLLLLLLVIASTTTFRSSVGVMAAFTPLESPCLRTCEDDQIITPEILQKCNDKCLEADHCCDSGRDSAANRLSCLNACEIAFYSSSVDQCKSHCSAAYGECEYNHPNVPGEAFGLCWNCKESCSKPWPDDDACEAGCDFAATFPEYYQYVEPPDTCEQANVPRFLFSGQSNMEGNVDEAIPGSFEKLVRIVNQKKSKKVVKNRIRRHLLNSTDVHTFQTARNQARMVYTLRRHMKKWLMFGEHPKTTCSYTNPNDMPLKLDCERPLTSTACGAHYKQYGPEFMFGHIFPKLRSPIKGQAVSISKIAVGGTTIYENWMKDMKDSENNYWYRLVDTIKGAQGTLEAFVWFQGENDTFMSDESKSMYLERLTKFVADVRQEIFDVAPTGKFASPSVIPVIICELGRWIDDLEDYNSPIINAQNAFVESDDYARLVKTGANTDDEYMTMTQFYHFDAASGLIIGQRIAQTMAKLLRGE